MATVGATTYDEVRSKHRWEVPERYNIARDVCFKHPPDKLAMVHEDPRGNVREVSWGELQELTNRFANVLAAHGVGKGDRVAMLLPPTPETAAAFLATFHSGAILLSMSVLYGDEGIRHRVRDSQAKLVVTNADNAERIRDAEVLILDDDVFARGEPQFDGVDTAADDPAQLYYTSGTTGLAKGIVHAHRYLRRCRRVCCAGERLNPEAIRWFREQYGITVLDYYGLTESYPLVANYPFMEVREGSMGKPMPGWDVEILDEDEHPVPTGERGEICLRARSHPHWPLGYWNNPEASEETFGGEWFHTKDAASQDEDGYIWFQGRADDVIISAGYRIGPFEVESACLEHPAVTEAAAVASPDERRGMIVKAYIVLAGGYEPSDELGRESSDFVRTRHSAYAYPRVVEFIDGLPKTLTGKIRRIELRDRESGR